MSVFDGLGAKETMSLGIGPRFFDKGESGIVDMITKVGGVVEIGEIQTAIVYEICSFDAELACSSLSVAAIQL